MNKRVWNPYLAGALAGVLLVLSVLVAGHFFGASTTFARGASVIEKAVGIDPSQFEYFTTSKGKYGPGSLPNWQLMFVVGIIIGIGSFGKISLPQIIGINHWIVIIVLAALTRILFRFFENKNL